MRNARQPRLEPLETRELLSTAHHVAPHARKAAPAPQLVLAGVLSVDNKASTTMTDSQGDTTTSIPVSGQLGSLGAVHGTWNESDDPYGDYLGPDTMKLRNSSGTIIVSFNEQQVGSRHKIAGGAVTYSTPQIASQGTGTYAGSRESGAIEFTTNSARTAVATMTLTSTSRQVGG